MTDLAWLLYVMAGLGLVGIAVLTWGLWRDHEE